MSNDGPGSLGALYESNARRHVPQMPSVAGTSIGSAYDAWFEADQEAQWLRNLDESRSHASSDHTQVIDLGEVDAYRERREAEDAWNLEADDALAVSGRPGAQRGSGASRVSRETPSSTQYSTRQRRGWEEPRVGGTTGTGRKVRAWPFGDSSVHLIPHGSGALLRC